MKLEKLGDYRIGFDSYAKDFCFYYVLDGQDIVYQIYPKPATFTRLSKIVGNK